MFSDLDKIKYLVEEIGIETDYLLYVTVVLNAMERITDKDLINIIKYLVKKGADINYIHPVTRMTGFHHAAFNGNKEMAKYIADKGADINKKLKGDVSIVRALKDDGKEDMAKFLITLGVSEEGCEGKCF